MDSLIALIWQVLMIPVGFFVGGAQERRHLRSLDQREGALSYLTVNNLKRVTDPDTVRQSAMVVGQVVIATDYYKSFVTSLRNLVGGEMKAAQSLLLRARREAQLRMLEEAVRIGAQEVWNVRFGFSNIAQMRGRQGAMQVELLAYGTAVVRQ